MTRILDVLEEFLDLRSYNYVRFDGSTKPDDRFVLVCLIFVLKNNLHEFIFLLILQKVDLTIRSSDHKPR